MRDYTDMRVTPPKRVSSPTWGTPPPLKQAIRPRLAKVKRQRIIFFYPEVNKLKLRGSISFIFRNLYSPTPLSCSQQAVKFLAHRYGYFRTLSYTTASVLLY